jgi:hypothetical protein
MSVPDDFDWSADNPDVVTHRQDSIAVYENAHGDVVIRREKDWNDEDVYIVVDKVHVPAVVAAMLRVAGLPMPGQALLPPPSPNLSMPTPAATRQKRYRDRQRDGERDAGRNARDGGRDGREAERNDGLFATARGGPQP